MNYPELRVKCIKVNPQRANSVILSFLKRTYITAAVPVTVMLNLLSHENFRDSHHKKFESVLSAPGFSQNILYSQSVTNAVSPLHSITRNTSTLWNCESLSQHNELSDKEVSELHHSKTWLFPVATTENSHALVF